MAKYEEFADLEDIVSDDEDTLKDRYLSFIIGDEDYGIEIKYVTEIVGIQKITQVPNVKEYIKGIINLRGIIIPVVEVRTRFRMNLIEYNDRTCIIVVNVRNVAIGLIVDEVSEVLNIPKNIIDPPPQTNKGTNSAFIQGVGKVGNDVKFILDINKLLYDDNKPANTQQE